MLRRDYRAPQTRLRQVRTDQPSWANHQHSLANAIAGGVANGESADIVAEDRVRDTAPEESAPTAGLFESITCIEDGELVNGARELRHNQRLAGIGAAAEAKVQRRKLQRQQLQEPSQAQADTAELQVASAL